MAKKILVVTGSHRAGGNSDTLAEAFIRGAREAGHEVERFDAGRAHILPCIDCKVCKAEGKCVFNDDYAEKVAPLLQWADSIVFVSPLYWYDVTASIKLFIDKFVSVKFKIDESALLMCGAVQDKNLFDGAVQVYKRLTQGSVKWTDRGVVLANGCGDKGAIEGHPALEEAYELGKNW